MTAIAISQSQAGTYQGKSTDTLELRHYCSRDWTDSEGKRHYKGKVGSKNFYDKTVCTVDPVTRVITIPSVTMQSTDDALDGGNVRITSAIYVRGKTKAISTHLKKYVIPAIGAATNWNDIRLFNFPAIPADSLPDSIVNDVFTAIANISYAPDASDVEKGRTRVEPAPEDATDPVTLGKNHFVNKRLLQSRYRGEFASFGEAVSAIGATPTDFIVSEPETTITSNYNLPPTLNFIFDGKGKLNVGAGSTVTINQFGNKKIFDGPGKVVFTRKSGGRLKLSNWTGNDDTQEITDKLNQALLSVAAIGGGVVEVPSGTWETYGGHTVYRNVIVQGVGANPDSGAAATVLKLKDTSQNNHLFFFGENLRNPHFRDLTMDVPSGAICILAQGANPNPSFGFAFDNCGFFGGMALKINSTANNWQVAQIDFRRCWFICDRWVDCNTNNSLLNIDGFYGSWRPGSICLNLQKNGMVRIANGEIAGIGVRPFPEYVNGEPSTIWQNSTFLRLGGERLPVTLENVQDEGGACLIEVAIQTYAGTINVNGCLVQSLIRLNGSCILNLNGSQFALERSIRDAADSNSVVYARGCTFSDFYGRVRSSFADHDDYGDINALSVPQSTAKLAAFVGGSYVACDDSIYRRQTEFGQYLKFALPIGFNGNLLRPHIDIQVNERNKREIRLFFNDGNGNPTVDGNGNEISYVLSLDDDYKLKFEGTQTGFAAFIFAGGTDNRLEGNWAISGNMSVGGEVEGNLTVEGDLLSGGVKTDSLEVGENPNTISNLRHSLVTLVGGVKTVNDSLVNSATKFFVNRHTDGGTVAASYSITRINGTSYTVTAKDGSGGNQTLDTSVLSLLILQP